jgi:hypothetical protein
MQASVVIHFCILRCFRVNGLNPYISPDALRQMEGFTCQPATDIPAIKTSVVTHDVTDNSFQKTDTMPKATSIQDENGGSIFILNQNEIL